MTELVCLVCNNIFKVKPSHKKYRKTCSRKCSAIRKKKLMCGVNNHQYGLTGKKNSSWKGGKVISNLGYVLICEPKKATRNDGYVLEHRLIMENRIKRKLHKNEIVHHKNEIRTDNRIENLEILTLEEHSRFHGKIRKQERNFITGRFI